ncbi:MAG: glycosyltransferase [Candidatus Bathyarchaeia archaeon]
MAPTIIATHYDHASFRNQATLIEKLYREMGREYVRINEYFRTPYRNPTCNVIVFGSPISDWMRFYSQFFMTYAGKKWAYFTAEGPIDNTYYPPTLYMSYTVVANSAWTKEWLRDAGIKVHHIVHHAIDLQMIEEAKASAQRLNDKTTLTYVGQTGPRKRVDLMLNAFEKAVYRTQQGIALYTISALDSLSPNLSAHVHQVATFGSKSHLEVLSLIASSDYYIHLSTCEGFGLPALEARALGIPLICVDMDPTREFIPRKGALWVKYHNTVKVDGYGWMSFIEHIYDPLEAAELIEQAHDIRLNYPSHYEDMRQHLLEGIEEYDYHNKYRIFLT